MRERLTVSPPPDLASYVERLLDLGETQLASRNFIAALDTLAKAYEALLKSQPPGRRYNKSGPLWLQALAYWYGRLGIGAAKRAALFAIVEEILTIADKRGKAPRGLTSDVARNAQVIAGLSHLEIGRLLSHLGEAVAAGRLIDDPETAVVETDLMLLYAIGSPGRETQQQPGRFSSSWSERVFVGGDYTAHLAELNEIAEVIRGRKWDAVLAWSYFAPPPFVHHHALMLLHECRWAVFDVSSSAGQLMELERTRDYGIDPLVVFQASPSHGHLSAMVRDLLARLGNNPMKYSTMGELRTHVDNYLTAAEAEAALDPT